MLGMHGYIVEVRGYSMIIFMDDDVLLHLDLDYLCMFQMPVHTAIGIVSVTRDYGSVG